MKNKYIKGIAITFLVIIAIVLGFVLFKYGINHKTIFTNIDEFKEVILSYGSFSFLAFLFIQILQIVLFFIPGEAVQVAGGYIFGPYISFLLCISGAVIGSAITFLVTRKFGKPFLQKICGKDNLWLVKKLDSSKSGEKKHNSHRKLIFALYLIPGVPKDLLGYICGVADISLKDFLILSTVGRAPALF
ncbi:MAG: TVP38/TMEM64 family protein, partial [Sarcina sp.]